jgi:hypothetical protein
MRQIQQYKRSLELRASSMQILITVCAWCQRVKDGDGSYRAARSSETNPARNQLSHGICPECRDRHFPTAAQMDA